MTFTAIVTRDKDKPGSYRWTIRAGINQPSELPPSRSQRDRSAARREVERLFGKLDWKTGQEAGSNYDYITDAAIVTIQPQ